MDIEITSARDDETFTWRAAKARQPKGTVTASVLPPGAKVGDVVRVEAEIEIDGITILGVLPGKEKAPPADRIEVLGSQRPVAGVTTVLAGPADKRRESPFFRDGGGERRPRKPEGVRSAGRPGGPASARAPMPGTSGAAERGDASKDHKREAERDRRPPARRDRPAGESSPGSRPREGGEHSTHREGTRPPRDVGGPRRDSGGPPEGALAAPRREGAPPRTEGRGRRPEAPPATRRGPVRLEPSTKHRDDFMETLASEQKPIAERLAFGGLPAVRKAVADEQEKAKAEGRPPVNADPILSLAEQLLPDVKAAVWMDRAEAAAARIDDLSLRDLRATVIAAATRTDAGRELERQLREGLDRRVAKLRSDWEEHLTQALADGRVLQALRLSARPPEPTARFPAALVERLASSAGAAMTSDTAPDRWLALLEAAVTCPVRRQIKPAGIPEDPTGEVQRKAREAAGRVPALAQLLGMAMPPPPQPLPGERPVRPHLPRPMRPPRPPRPVPAPPAPKAPKAEEPVVEPAAEEPVVEPPAEEPVVEPVAEEPVVEPALPSSSEDAVISQPVEEPGD
jgi:hypothetical protein